MKYNMKDTDHFALVPDFNDLGSECLIHSFSQRAIQNKSEEVSWGKVGKSLAYQGEEFELDFQVSREPTETFEQGVNTHTHL